MLESLFLKYNSSIENKLNNFEKYVKRQALGRFIARYEIFKQVINIKGSIVECGVHHGGGLFAWAKLSADLEPYAIHRKIIGFDTFEGFPSIDEKDISSKENPSNIAGGFNTGFDIYSELKECVQEYDNNRFLNQFEKVELVKGDATLTIPKYVKENPHLIVSILFMDFDLYEPTKIALEYLSPKVPKGGIIAFDEINNAYWPGETVALFEKFNTLNNIQIQKFPFDPNMAYIVV